MKKPAPGDPISQPVYSTETGDLRKSGLGGSLGRLLGGSGGPSGSPRDSGSNPIGKRTPSKDSLRKLTVRLERKGRRGKTVTLIEHYPAGHQQSPEDLAKAIKTHCGTGGSLEPDGTILIQGDQRDRIAQFLRNLGLTPSVSG